MNSAAKDMTRWPLFLLQMLPSFLFWFVLWAPCAVPGGVGSVPPLRSGAIPFLTGSKRGFGVVAPPSRLIGTGAKWAL